MLSARGHKLNVLTSRDEEGAKVDDDGSIRVHRLLELEVEGGLLHTVARLALGGREASERRNITTVERIVAEFRPDAALIWGMWNVPRVVPAAVERLLPTAYYLCDYWPALPNAYIQRLEEPARNAAMRFPKQLLSSLLLPGQQGRPRVDLAFCDPTCVSYAVRENLVQNGIKVQHAQIIRNGIHLNDFLGCPSIPGSPSGHLQLVYFGRITSEKGVHTAIQAVRLLVGDANHIRLDIFGTGNTGYTEQLKKDVQEFGLPVYFHGFVPRDQIPQVLIDHHVLVFPSEWEEPLARSVIEAMAAGLCVIGTTTGGTGELLVENETGLTFRTGDAADLARQIARLADDPELRERLAAAGREIVLHEFSIDRTVDQLENLLASVAANPAMQPA